MNFLLLEFIEADEIDDDVFHLTTESYISAFVWKLLNAHDELGVKLAKTNSAIDTSVPTSLKKIKYEIVTNEQGMKLPMLQLEERHNIVGLCSVLRGICRLMKLSPSGELATQLLGFKEVCLLSPSEVSVWTSFCEREMISSYRRLQAGEAVIQFPLEMIKLERDLANPVRVHNVYKVARDLKKDQKIKSGSELDLDHKFCHGNEVNLSDVVLYSIYKLIFTTSVDIDDVKHIIPLTVKWFENMELGKFNETFDVLVRRRVTRKSSVRFQDEIPQVNDDGKYFSLLKRDVSGHKSKKRNVFTDQTGIDVVLEKLKSLNIEIKSSPGDPNQESINDDYVCELLKCGELLASRFDRKKSQLKSLTIEVLKIAQPSDIIVDFCSGTGHLGFLIAKLLPKCHVIVLENKEESINRAKVKAKILELKNVTFYQCNLVSC